MKQIEDLIAISRKFGQDSRFVIAGGGNTSYKDENRLWVKASGHALATITEDGVAVLDRALLNEMGEKAYNEDTAIREEQVKNDLSVACITKDRRPSVETSLHNWIRLRGSPPPYPCQRPDVLGERRGRVQRDIPRCPLH